MAYDVERQAGGFARARAAAEQRVALTFAALLLGSVLAALGLIVAGVSGAISALALLAVGVIARQFADDRFDAVFSWSKGANGEAAIGETLDELRRDGHILMHDLENVVPGNVDHLVSGPNGVFMIETKFRRYADKDPAKARHAAAVIAEELGIRWVQPVICFATRDYGPITVRRVAVVGREQLLDYIRSQRNPTVPFERLARFADRQ